MPPEDETTASTRPLPEEVVTPPRPHYGKPEEEPLLSPTASRSFSIHRDEAFHAGGGDGLGSLIEPLRRPSTMRRKSFLQEFAYSDGAPQIIALILLFALAVGSTIGVVPAVMMDRYARLRHGYTGQQTCAELLQSNATAAPACLAGSADAQNAVTMEELISNTLAFLTSSYVGSLSDEHGRKDILVLGVFLCSLSPLSLVLIQMRPNMSPVWYYSAGAITGFISWITVAISVLADVMPPNLRAASFGLVYAGFGLGFALAPMLALFLGHFYVSVLALALIAIGLVLAIAFLPETLAPEAATHARQVRQAQLNDIPPGLQRVLWSVLVRPLWELSILNRSSLFRLLSLLAFFSGVVVSGDRTLLVYYIEERLNFTDKDIAILFLIMGCLAIFVQGYVLKVLNDIIGERRVVMLSFFLGGVHNLLYGLAGSKALIYAGVALSAFVGMAFPSISAIKSNNVNESEQGRIQGALSATQSLAAAAGPTVMRGVYHYTKNGTTPWFGPGSMFLVASLFYFVAVYYAGQLPSEAHSHRYDLDISPSSFDDSERGIDDAETQTALIHQ